MEESAWLATSHGVPGAAMAACLEAAIRAPSVHNTQPWLFRLRGAAIDVLVDPRRQLKIADPDGREMHISVGAALLNLRAAIFAAGRQPHVRLLPDHHQPDVVATVTIGAEVPVGPDDQALADAITLRRTNRRPFGSTPIPHAVIAALINAASTEGGILDVVEDPGTRATLFDLERTADRRNQADPLYRAELAAWTNPAPERGDGVPPEAFGPRPELVTIPTRDFDLARTTDRRVARFEPEPTIALLSTAGDTRRDWLNAGQALERVLLTATVHGVSTMPMTQALEMPDLRQLLSTPTRALMAQSVVRLGYAGRGTPTPRRPIADVLVATRE